MVLNCKLGLMKDISLPLRWCASSSIFATNCEVGRGTNSRWKSAGWGVRESIPDPVPRGPGYVVCIWLFVRYMYMYVVYNHVMENATIRIHCREKKNPNVYDIFRYSNCKHRTWFTIQSRFIFFIKN